MAYARFVAMIATSTIVMFGLMYLPSYRDRGVAPPAGETDADAGIDTLAPIR